MGAQSFLTIFPTTLQPTLALISIVIISLAAVLSIVKHFLDPLRVIPGPWIAGFTNIWRLWNGLSGKEEIINLELHEKYGKNRLAQSITAQLGIKISWTDLLRTLSLPDTMWSCDFLPLFETH